MSFFVFQEKVISGGNDEKVLVHDLETGKTLDIFPHDEPVYGIACHPECSELFASASSDGRVLVFDLRESNVNMKWITSINDVKLASTYIILLEKN